MRGKSGKYLFLVWGAILFAILAVFYLPKCKRPQTEEVALEISEWIQVLEDGEERAVYLPEKLNKGTAEIRLYTYLPEKCEENQRVCFWTESQDVEVYLEEELIYTNIGNAERFGKAAVSQWHIVKIPEESAGKKIDLYFYNTYESERFVLAEVLMGTGSGIESWINGKYASNYMMDLVLIIIGGIFSFYACFQKHNTRYRTCYFCLGEIAFLFGCWFSMGTKGVQGYWLGPYVKTLFGYLAFFLAPIPLTIYVKQRLLKAEKFIKGCDFLITLQCALVPVVFLLQAFSIKDVRECCIVGQVVMIIAVAWAVFAALYYYVKEKENTAFLTVINSFLMVVVACASWIEGSNITTKVRIEILMRICTVMILILEFVMIFEYLKQEEKVHLKLAKENKNLQLQVLTGQIRPHFILNTLGAIRTLIGRDPDRASDLLYDFAKYIRRNMEQKDYSKLVPFLEELDYIETYLNLEMLRFDDKLQVNYDIREESFWILPLTIQPFVENAVKHGLLPTKHGGTLWITTYRTEEYIQIEIQDDGVGFNTRNFWTNLEKGNSVGMKSAIYRLKNEMGAECEVKSSLLEGRSGTCIEIKIPVKEAVRNENNNCR